MFSAVHSPSFVQPLSVGSNGGGNRFFAWNSAQTKIQPPQFTASSSSTSAAVMASQPNHVDVSKSSYFSVQQTNHQSNHVGVLRLPSPPQKSVFRDDKSESDEEYNERVVDCAKEDSDSDGGVVVKSENSRATFTQSSLAPNSAQNTSQNIKAQVEPKRQAWSTEASNRYKRHGFSTQEEVDNTQLIFRTGLEQEWHTNFPGVPLPQAPTPDQDCCRRTKTTTPISAEFAILRRPNGEKYVVRSSCFEKMFSHVAKKRSSAASTQKCKPMITEDSQWAFKDQEEVCDQQVSPVPSAAKRRRYSSKPTQARGTPMPTPTPTPAPDESTAPASCSQALNTGVSITENCSAEFPDIMEMTARGPRADRKRYVRWYEILSRGQIDMLCPVCNAQHIQFNTNSHAAHVTAVKLGGTSHYANIRFTCASCNMDMKTEDMFEYTRRVHGREFDDSAAREFFESGIVDMDDYLVVRRVWPSIESNALNMAARNAIGAKQREKLVSLVESHCFLPHSATSSSSSSSSSSNQVSGTLQTVQELHHEIAQQKSTNVRFASRLINCVVQAVGPDAVHLLPQCLKDEMVSSELIADPGLLFSLLDKSQLSGNEILMQYPVRALTTDVLARALACGLGVECVPEDESKLLCVLGEILTSKSREMRRAEFAAKNEDWAEFVPDYANSNHRASWCAEMVKFAQCSEDDFWSQAMYRFALCLDFSHHGVNISAQEAFEQTAVAVFQFVAQSKEPSKRQENETKTFCESLVEFLADSFGVVSPQEVVLRAARLFLK